MMTSSGNFPGAMRYRCQDWLSTAQWEVLSWDCSVMRGPTYVFGDFECLLRETMLRRFQWQFVDEVSA